MGCCRGQPARPPGGPGSRAPTREPRPVSGFRWLPEPPATRSGRPTSTSYSIDCTIRIHSPPRHPLSGEHDGMETKSEQFIERMGQLVEAAAGPRIARRLLGLLRLTPGALSLDEIA